MSLEHIHAAPALGQLLNQISDGENIALSHIREQASQALADFSHTALSELQVLDISMPPAISLVSTGNQLRLSSTHPHASKISAWLQNNDRVTRQFKEVEVLYELIRATENVGQSVTEDDLSFHIGLTSAGPIAYFERSNTH